MQIGNHKIKKSLGQNFILDRTIAEQIISYAEPINGYSVIEIGPGLGVMTELILNKGVNCLIAIEKDEKLNKIHRNLEQKYRTYRYINGDACCYDLNTLTSGPTKVIANLPYNISVILLLKMLSNISHFETLTLMFQKEVAERIVAPHGTKHYSALSAAVQLMCDVEIVANLPPTAFKPSPKVYSSIVNLIPLKQQRFTVDFVYFTQVLKKIFHCRRKTIRNALKATFLGVDSILQQCEISPTSRVEQLSVEKLCSLANILQVHDNNTVKEPS